MKSIRSVVLWLFLFALAAAGCGGPATSTATSPPLAPPTNTPPPPPTHTPVPTPTLSARDHLDQGLALKENGQTEEAIAEFKAALELEPENAAAHANLGLALIDQERYDAAIPEFKTALAVEPDNISANGGLCVAYGFVQPDLGEAQCQKALESDPDNADLHNGLGIAYVLQGEIDQAIAAFKEALRLDPEHRWAHNNLGRMYSNQGRYPEALAELEEAIRINPGNALAHYNLGLTYARQEDYEQAIPEYEEAVRLNPALAEAYKDLGIIYRDLGQAAEAIAAFNKFLELRPEAADRGQIENLIAELQQPAEPQPGNSFEFDDVLETSGSEGGDRFSFFVSPLDLFGEGDNTVDVTVHPQAGLDVSLAVLDTSSSESKLVANVDEAGPGETEHLLATLPKAGPQMGVYAIWVFSKEGGGDYHASFRGSPAVGFFLSEDWEVQGVLGDQMALFFAIATFGTGGEPFTLEAVPQSEDLNLFILAFDTATNKDLGTLDETGPGEAEINRFVPGSSVYLFYVGGANGQPGQLVFSFHK